MTHGWRVIAGWGAWLCVLAAIQLIFGPTPIEFALLAGAGGGMILLGFVTFAGERQRTRPRPEDSDPVALPQTSAASVCLAVGITVFAVGWELGAWLAALGAGFVVLGAGGLIREWRAQQRP